MCVCVWGGGGGGGGYLSVCYTLASTSEQVLGSLFKYVCTYLCMQLFVVHYKFQTLSIDLAVHLSTEEVVSSGNLI